MSSLIERQAAIETVRKAQSIGQAHRMLLQLPSSQPDKWEDTVYRKAVERLLAYFVPEERYAEAVDGLRGLPSAQPGWIPWDSGKFPEESGTYTVTAYDGAKRRVTYAKYQKRLKRWELTGARAYWRVLAWMPHIEPWEGDTDAY